MHSDWLIRTIQLTDSESIMEDRHHRMVINDDHLTTEQSVLLKTVSLPHILLTNKI